MLSVSKCATAISFLFLIPLMGCGGTKKVNSSTQVNSPTQHVSPPVVQEAASQQRSKNGDEVACSAFFKAIGKALEIHLRLHTSDLGKVVSQGYQDVLDEYQKNEKLKDLVAGLRSQV